MKLIKGMILLGGVFLIAGMAFFQLFLLFSSLLVAKKIYIQHNPRHAGLTST